ncbi:MAG TPA: hypothetical protein VNX28_08395 [Gemmataceae bacterium]|nr:hypothetical protein [Gemmataceae bacterium]
MANPANVPISQPTKYEIGLNLKTAKELGIEIPPSLSDDPDPRGLMRPFPAEPMQMWPISTRVNKPENDDPAIVEPIELTTSAA